MYEIEELSAIKEIIVIENGIYLLKGFKDGKEIFGLYNSYQNDLVEVKYPNIKVVDGKIVLLDGESKFIYDDNKSKDNEPVRKGIKIVFDNNTYGIKNESGDIIIPCRFTREELMNIGSIEEALSNVYVLFDTIEREKPVGFYDKENDTLIKDHFTSYEILFGALVLKNKVHVNKRITHDRQIIEKSYISIYHPKFKRYITSEKYFDQVIKEICYFISPSYKSYRCLKTHHGMIILNNGCTSDGAIYDTENDLFMEDVFCKNVSPNQIELYNCDGRNLLFKGYYDLEKRMVKEYYRTWGNRGKNKP